MNLYNQTVPYFIKSLQALDNILTKADALAESKVNPRQPKEVFERQLLDSRNIFDQMSLLRQVQMACDNAKIGVARLSGIDWPKHDDTEQTIDDLKQRISETLMFLKGLQESQFEGTEERRIELPYYPGQYMTDTEYAMEYLIPNFYFHYVTAYTILRKNGLNIGKADFLGDLPLKEIN